MSDISSVTPTQLVPASIVVPFAQMQQKQQVQQAIGDKNRSVTSDDKKDQCKEFGFLMTKSMLALGTAYENQETFNGSNGKMGLFLQAAVKVAALEAAFAQAVQQLQSFGSLKCWLNAPSSSLSTSEKGSVGTFATMFRSEVNGFGTEGSSDQSASEQQSEVSIIAQKAAALGSQAQSTQTTAKNLQNQGGNLLGDEGTVGDFLEQISAGFSQV